jgi:deazaflavin-dependent oxidoreductase (nitroreductase family)
VGNGLRGDTFWIVTEHGWSADYVKNIARDPHVRVKVGRRWRSGTARILVDEDPYERMRKLRRRTNDALVRAVGTEHLVIRIDLD